MTIPKIKLKLLIAKSGKPYNIGEELSTPAAKTTCSIMLGESAVKEMR